LAHSDKFYQDQELTGGARPLEHDLKKRDLIAAAWSVWGGKICLLVKARLL